MRLNWIDQLGNWNPQLLREIKGRFQVRNLLLAGAISLVGQFFLWRFCQALLPTPNQENGFDIYSRYCTGTPTSYQTQVSCLSDKLGNIAINWQLWWQDFFVWLSLVGIFVLLVAGTYLLITDLAAEERQQSLNFIRLSPQTPQSILVGKMLGVPILLYLTVGLALPLHLGAGIAAHLSVTAILSFYAIALASCIFFYSAALLFALVSYRLNGFQAWLGSGAVLICCLSAVRQPLSHTPADWRQLFSPTLILPQLLPTARAGLSSWLPTTSDLQWFYLPLGASTFGVLGFALANYALWTYWSWQALQRRFPNPSKTILSKRQSYLFVACWEVLIIGFAATTPKWPYSTELSVNFKLLLLYNLLLFLSLIAALTPQRQALQDWARYRQQQVVNREFWRQNLVRDVIWGEKSPALVAIALNLAITSASLIPWMALKLQAVDKLPASFSLVIGINFILIYAAIAQLLVLMRTQKQALWVTGTIGTVSLLPPLILSLLSLHPHEAPTLWLFTPFAWAAIEQASTVTIFLSILGQWGILTLSAFQIVRQLRQVGESNSKALFATRQPSLPSS